MSNGNATISVLFLTWMFINLEVAIEMSTEIELD